MPLKIDSTDSTDYEERVLHYGMYVSPQKLDNLEGKFTVRDVAIFVNIHEGRARSIILQLINLEVFKRQRIYPEHVFRYEPTELAMSLGKVRKLHADAAEIERQRKKQTAREVRYVTTR
jgi:hypothetical protein